MYGIIRGAGWAVGAKYRNRSGVVTEYLDY